jgi:hypothetical protein
LLRKKAEDGKKFQKSYTVFPLDGRIAHPSELAGAASSSMNIAGEKKNARRVA